jgi:threonine synthase
VAFATNANRSIPRYIETGKWQPEETIATLASAMDVGNPSNMERLRQLFPTADDLASAVTAWSVNDEQIRASIADAWQKLDMALCPHTASAWQVRQWLREDDPGPNWIVVATAHPAKFETIVEPIIDQRVPMPDALAELMQRPVKVEDIEVGLDSLRTALLDR